MEVGQITRETDRWIDRQTEHHHHHAFFSYGDFVPFAGVKMGG